MPVMPLRLVLVNPGAIRNKSVLDCGTPGTLSDLGSRTARTMLSHSLILVGALQLAAPPSPIARTVSSDDGLRLARRSVLEWQAARTCPPVKSFQIMPSERRQTIAGFGASMTESSAININALSEDKQSTLLEELFGASGARFSALKAPMLANDFATQAPWATYDDVAGDVDLDHFSIARDLQPNGSLTMIKRALAAGFEGTIQSYMDYPPDWMLTGKLPAATLQPRYYDVLAKYFARFVQAYAASGVQIDFLECFNEPTDSYTRMSPPELATFLKGHVGPTFDRLGLRPRTRLTYGGQATRSGAHQFVTEVMSDPDASKYMDLIAYHGYDCQLADADNPRSHCNDTRMGYGFIADLASRYGKEIWMTEAICARVRARHGGGRLHVHTHSHVRACECATCRCATRTTPSTATMPTRARTRRRWQTATSTREIRRWHRRCPGATSLTASPGRIASLVSCRLARPAGYTGTWPSTRWAVRTTSRRRTRTRQTIGSTGSSSSLRQAGRTR